MDFPGEKPFEVVVRSFGSLQLVNRAGRVFLKRGTKLLVRAVSDGSFASLQSVVFGDVLEIGLGLGGFTVWAAALPAVTKVWAVELDPEFISLFESDVNTPKIQVLNRDVFGDLSSIDKMFDFVHFDIAFDESRTIFNKSVTFLTGWLPAHLNSGAVLTVTPSIYTKDLVSQISASYSSHSYVRGGITGSARNLAYVSFVK